MSGQEQLLFVFQAKKTWHETTIMHDGVTLAPRLGERERACEGEIEKGESDITVGGSELS